MGSLFFCSFVLYLNLFMLALFNIGGGELLIIVLVIVMFFGSKKIPEIARALGKGISELKNATSGIQQEIRDSVPSEVTNLKKNVSVEHQVKSFIKKEITKPIEDKDVDDASAPEEDNTPTPPNSISRS